MTIPSVSRTAIENALNEFNSKLRESSDWINWETNKAHAWALVHNEKRYPPKKIISMAAGVPVNSFAGGPETNNYLKGLGFSVTRIRDTSIGDVFDQILATYPAFRKTEAFGGSHVIRELFLQATQILEESDIVRARRHLNVVGSWGKGNWATVPWISILDDRETRTTQDGTYVVYLFRADGKGCYLKLAQGVTRISEQLGAAAGAKLAESAAKIRSYCADLVDLGFDLSGNTELGADQKLAKLYEASTAASKYYECGAMPTQQEMLSDLDALLKAYERYIHDRTEQHAITDERRLSLIGSWRDAENESQRIQEHIRDHGGWASSWSFSIKDQALPRLKLPFFIYAYSGKHQLSARLRVDDFRTSKGSLGIESPWPEITDADLLGKIRLGDRQSVVFKTWFRVGELTILNPKANVGDFEVAIGLSSISNLLNQNSFGYVIENQHVSQSRAVKKESPPPLPLDWLISRTGLPAELITEIVDALMGDSPQIMLAGPPGTSKSWIAHQLALFITRNRPELTRFVQFHPSYSYESFMEGLRPVSHPNGITFDRCDGVLLELVKKIHGDGNWNSEADEYAIVMDEANRANLPRVLGELMYLFEYREKAIRLQYSNDFSLPRNLRFIATMNTADRSIRSVDVALRRRFDVFELLPSATVLGNYYESSGRESAVRDLLKGFEELNGALEAALDKHHTIGHAFFMHPRMDSQHLRNIWRRKVFPLIEEFFFDQHELAMEFSMERFWPSVR